MKAHIDKVKKRCKWEGQSGAFLGGKGKMGDIYRYSNGKSSKLAIYKHDDLNFTVFTSII